MNELKNSWPPLAKMPEPGEVYSHVNGRAYEVLALANDTDREDILVILRGEDGCVWSRRVGNFMGLKAGGARFRLNQAENKAEVPRHD